MLGLGLACLAGGAALVGRVFAIDWAQLLTLPAALKRLPELPREENPFKPPRNAGSEKREPRPEPVIEHSDRRPPEISDPMQTPRPARPAGTPKQKDLFDAHQLPSLDLLTDVPVDKGPKLDKLALERNARLLETVLDDFNVKGEITAVRTGPVVTMYELEPAPGIKASRVIGLAEDIARNMSAISARVSASPSASRSSPPARRSRSTRATCRSSWARTSAANRSSPISPPCRTCWSPARPARASRSGSTRSCCRCSTVSRRASAD
jgi:S-DNA-T family DNA segregation ATPase FtsK/SpoIIIE